MRSLTYSQGFREGVSIGKSLRQDAIRNIIRKDRQRIKCRVEEVLLRMVREMDDEEDLILTSAVVYHVKEVIVKILGEP